MAKKQSEGLIHGLAREVGVNILSAPVLAGISCLGATMTQRVPYLSNFGDFGMLMFAICIFVLLSLGKWLQHQAAPVSARKNPKTLTKYQKIILWWGWKWIIFISFVFAACLLIDFKPTLPAFVNPSQISLPVASFREMNQSSIIGKTVILSQVPTEKNAPYNQGCPVERDFCC